MPPDLDVASVLIWCADGRFEPDAAAYFRGLEDDPASTDHQIVHYDLEISICGGADRFGHFSYHLLHDIGFPPSRSQGPIQEWALAQNAVVGASHSQLFASGYDEFPSLLLGGFAPLEAPIAFALGRAHYVSFQPPGRGWRFLWYTLLDSGLRPSIGSTSDSNCQGIPIGRQRTYARLDGPFSYESFVRAVAAGSVSVGTSGEGFLEFSVDEAETGEQLDLSAMGVVTARARLILPRSHTNVGVLEIIRNQEVVAFQSYAQAGGEVVLEAEVEIAESSWLSARTESTHAGAVFALVDDAPIRSSVDSPDYHVRYLDWLEAAIVEGTFPDIGPSDDDQILADIDLARAIFQQIRIEAIEVSQPGAASRAVTTVIVLALLRRWGRHERYRG